MSKPLVAITGASSGIGAAAARAFSAAGHPLLLTARRVERLEALALPDTLCRKHDVADADGYRDLVAEAEAAHGPVDLLINNAGYMHLEQVSNQQADNWRRQFDVNCIGLLNTTNAVYPDHTVYCGTKHAVHALTEGLRREGAAAGVRVIMISPGMVDTELLSSTESDSIKDGYRAYRDEIGGAITPTDIAEAMLYAYGQPQNICIWELVVAPTRQLT
jgi:NADP-dependent 3-hydroxy acid dehydrogenase YdfG